MKTYTTGKVAEALGIPGARGTRKVAKMIDEGVIKGKTINGKDGRARRGYRVVSHHCLAHYIEEHGGIKARKWLLRQERESFENIITEARGTGGVFASFKYLPDELLQVVKIMDPLDNLSGKSEDRKRREIFQKLVRLMNLHIRLRELIALQKN